MAHCRRVSLEEFRKLLDGRPADSVLLLAGAGISMPAPTSLPSGNALRDLCVKLLLTDSRSRSAVRRLLSSRGYQALLPESVLQMIGSTVGRGLDDLMRRLLGAQPPNEIHVTLASRKWQIFTTNFDLCLESAGATPLSHLHGSIRNPGELQNQLYRLGKTALLEARKFERALKGRTLLILGYSFRDDDIVRMIQNHPPLRVLFLSFDGVLPPGLRSLRCDVLFAQGSAQDLFETNPGKTRRSRRSLRPAEIRLPAVKHRVNALIRICSRAGLCDQQLRLLRLYAGRLHARSRLLAMCEVADSLRLARRYGEAESLANSVLGDRFSRLPACRDVVSTALVQLGLVALDRGDRKFEDIAAHFRRASKVFEDLVRSEPPGRYEAENDIWRARILNNTGLLLAAQDEIEESIRMYRRSIRLKSRHHDRYGISQTLANIAVAQILDRNLSQAAQTVDQLLARLTQDPDAYICADAVVGCLGALRKTNRFRTPVRNLAIVPMRSERWWRGLQEKLRIGSKPEVRLLSALKRLGALSGRLLNP